MPRRERRAVARAVEGPLDGLEGPGVEAHDPGLGEPSEDAVGEGVRQSRPEAGAFDARFQFQSARPLVAGGAGLTGTVGNGDVVALEFEPGRGGAEATILAREPQAAFDLLRLFGLLGPEGQGGRGREAGGETGEDPRRPGQLDARPHEGRDLGPRLVDAVGLLRELEAVHADAAEGLHPGSEGRLVEGERGKRAVLRVGSHRVTGKEEVRKGRGLHGILDADHREERHVEAVFIGELIGLHPGAQPVGGRPRGTGSLEPQPVPGELLLVLEEGESAGGDGAPRARIHKAADEQRAVGLPAEPRVVGEVLHRGPIAHLLLQVDANPVHVLLREVEGRLVVVLAGHIRNRAVHQGQADVGDELRAEVLVVHHRHETGRAREPHPRVEAPLGVLAVAVAVRSADEDGQAAREGGVFIGDAKVPVHIERVVAAESRSARGETAAERELAEHVDGGGGRVGPGREASGAAEDLEALDVVGGQEGGLRLAHAVDHHQPVGERVEAANDEEVEDAEARNHVDRRGAFESIRELARALLPQVPRGDDAQGERRLLQVHFAPERPQSDGLVVGGGLHVDGDARTDGRRGSRLGQRLRQRRGGHEDGQERGKRANEHPPILLVES